MVKWIVCVACGESVPEAGTAVSQVYYWIARSVVALRSCLKQSWRVFCRYWLRQTALLGIIVAAVWISSGITQNLFVGNPVLTFIVRGIICETCFAVLAFVCCRGIAAERRLERAVGKILLKRFGKQHSAQADRIRHGKER